MEIIDQKEKWINFFLLNLKKEKTSFTKGIFLLIYNIYINILLDFYDKINLKFISLDNKKYIFSFIVDESIVNKINFMHGGKLKKK